MSTSSSASEPAASIASRTSGTRLVTPVDVSLCTTITAAIEGSDAQDRRDLVGIDAVAPVARHPVDLEPEPLGHRPPQRREVAGLERQHAVAGRQRVDQRGLPRAGPRRRVDDHRAGGAEHLAGSGQDLLAERGERRPAMVDRRVVDRAQHPVGHVRRPRDLQEVTSHRCMRVDISWPVEELVARAAARARGRGARRRLHAPPVRVRREHVRPRAALVAFPRGADDVAAAIALAGRFDVPVVSRGAGTSLTGQTIGAGALVLDTSRHMDAIGEIDAGNRRVRVGPGRGAGRPQPRGRSRSGSASGRTPRPRTGPRSAG